MYVATISRAPKITHFHTNLIFSQAICTNKFNIKEALVVSTTYDGVEDLGHTNDGVNIPHIGYIIGYKVSPLLMFCSLSFV